MPQPIDPNTELARISAAERIQQIADRASLAAQTRHAAEAIQQQSDMETQVGQARQKSEEVNEELRRKNPFAGRKRRKSDKGHEEEHPEHVGPLDEGEGRHLDVTI